MGRDRDSIWHSEPKLEYLNEMGRNSLVHHLGIRFTEIGANFLRATMEVNASTRQPLGLLHGGASCALAETLASTAATLMLDTNDQFAVGMEINANHVKGIREGWVTATTRPQHIGRTTHVWSIDINNEQGELICVSRMTVAIVDHRRQRPQGGE